MKAALALVDRDPRWFAAGLIVHTMLTVGLLVVPLLIVR
jgi:hypothetical protein